jgi:hypothetical protein
MRISFSETFIGLEIWKNHLCPSMGPNVGSMAMDPESRNKLPEEGYSNILEGFSELLRDLELYF